MLQFLHKIHSLFFYKLVRFVHRIDQVFMDIPDMEWVMNKALLAISLIQMFWFFILWTIGEIIIGKTAIDFFESQFIPIIILVAIITAFDYFTLIYKKRWFQYDEEFAAYSKTKNRLINVVFVFYYILTFILFYVVMNIWADLGHAGKIEGY